jgi:hypothetical protein
MRRRAGGDTCNSRDSGGPPGNEFDDVSTTFILGLARERMGYEYEN